MKEVIIALALFLAAPYAYAADGDACSLSLPIKGKWRIEACYLICDDASSDGACTLFDTDTWGMPDVLILDIEDTNGNCTGTPAATITTSHESDGSPDFDISTTTVILDDDPKRVVIDTQGGLVNRYIKATLATTTGCDGLDVRAFFANRKD